MKFPSIEELESMYEGLLKDKDMSDISLINFYEKASEIHRTYLSDDWE